MSIAPPNRPALKTVTPVPPVPVMVPKEPAAAPPKVVHVAPSRKTYRTDTVVISDVHLGSEVCQAKLLRRALKEWYPFRRLIILGDLFDDLNFSRLGKHHFNLIDDFRKLTNKKRGVSVDWIEGNHDEEAHDVVRRMIGANVHEELLLELHGKSYLFIHGHQFDDFLVDHPIISTIASNFYESVQRRQGEGITVSRWLKRKSKGWIKACQRVQQKAVAYAAVKGDVDFIVCGHTHYHNAVPILPTDRIKYINTGCWTDLPCTLTTVDEHGLRHHEYM